MSHDALKEDDVTDIEGRLIERTNDSIRLALKVPKGAETGPRTLVIKDSAGNVIARRSNMVRIVPAARPRPAPEEDGKPAKPPTRGAGMAAKKGAVDTTAAKPRKGGPRRATKSAAKKGDEEKKS